MTAFSMPLERFDPIIAEWFAKRFGQPNEPQIDGWAVIAAGNDVLLSAPTGQAKPLQHC